MTDRSVLIDLSRLNRILDFHEKLAYVTVEPGVTQRQLFRLLEDRRSGLWMDAPDRVPIAVLSAIQWSAASVTPPMAIISRRCAVLKLFCRPATSWKRDFAASRARRPARLTSGAPGRR